MLTVSTERKDAGQVLQKRTFQITLILITVKLMMTYKLSYVK